MISFLRRNKTVLGPAAFTLIMLFWTAAVRPHGHYGSWPAWPVLAGAPLLLGWHLWFVFTRPQKLRFLTYALADLLVYVQLAILEMTTLLHRGI
jgi:hypothetical protein